MVNDYAPEILVGDPWGEYKATTYKVYSGSAALAKGDFVSLYTGTDEPGTVTAAAKDDYALGVVMKAAAAGSYASIGVFGDFKVVAGTGGIAAGASVLPYSQSTAYGVTTKTGFARGLQTLAVGDSGLIHIMGGVG